jgi:hypothetical protein
VVDNGVDNNEGVKIRKITPAGFVTTFSDEGIMSSALDTDAAGNLYLGGGNNDDIYKYSPNGVRTTLINLNTYIINFVIKDNRDFLFTQGGSLASENAQKILKADLAGTVTTLAGSGETGFKDGKGEEAQFNYPTGLCLDKDGNIVVIDALNNRIRKVSKL